MAQVEMPWLESSNPSLSSVPLLDENPSRWKRIQNHPSLKIWGFLLLLVVILFLGFYRVEDSSLNRDTLSAQTLILGAVIEIPKGEYVKPELLRALRVPPKALSPAQRLKVLMPDDMDRLQSRLRAKRDLPPNRPIYWKDLELEAPPKLLNSKPALKIHFGEGKLL